MSDKYKRRGEIGELLLPVLCREVFKTYPAITKYFCKDSSKNTLKGFDAVHVVVTEAGLELWLGESKFYENIGQAISDAVQDLKSHTKRDYMRASAHSRRKFLAEAAAATLVLVGTPLIIRGVRKKHFGWFLSSRERVT
jgi:hypothetical protein